MPGEGFGPVPGLKVLVKTCLNFLHLAITAALVSAIAWASALPRGEAAISALTTVPNDITIRGCSSMVVIAAKFSVT